VRSRRARPAAPIPRDMADTASADTAGDHDVSSPCGCADAPVRKAHMSPLRAACQDDEDRSMQSLDDSIPSLVASSSMADTASADTAGDHDVSFSCGCADAPVRKAYMSPLRAACQDDEDRSMQSLDDSIPSLVASSSESETDSDEEDYRQLEAQEEASRWEPVRVGPQSRAPTATPSLRAGRVAGTAARSATWPDDSAPWHDHNSSDESLPDLVASSSSEGEVTDEDERPRRNVRPRHSHTPNTDWQRSPSRYGLGRREPGTGRVTIPFSARATRPQWAGRGVAEAWQEAPETMAEPFPRAEPSLRANVRHSNYYSRWNSATWQHPSGAAQAGQHGAGQPQVVGAFQVLDGGALFGPFDQGDDIVIGEGADDFRGFRSVRPIDLLSSILGSQGLRVDGTSEAFIDGDFDPIMQVSAAETPAVLAALEHGREYTLLLCLRVT